MNLWTETLEVIGIPLVIIVLFIGSIVWLPFLRRRRSALPDPRGILQADEWDFTVGGKVMATLIPAGPAEELDDTFFIDEVRIVAGHEEDVQKLLYHSDERDADDARICYRSRSGDGVILKDSQVHAEQCGEHRVQMTICPTEKQLEQAVEFIKDHPAPPRNLETPAPRAE